MWISLFLMTGTLVILQLFESLNETAYKVVMISLIPLGIGYGGFLGNVIQFGVDQLSDASSCEIKAFVSWYSWTCVSSQLAGSFALYYIPKQYKILILALLMSANLTISVSMNILFKNVLIKEPGMLNPFKNVYKVIYYVCSKKLETEVEKCLYLLRRQYPLPH